MDALQLAIIAVSILFILSIIIYYWYQETKFKQIIEKKFNQKTDDVITSDDMPVVLDGAEMSDQTTLSRQDVQLKFDLPIINKDVYENKKKDVTATIALDENNKNVIKEELKNNKGQDESLLYKDKHNDKLEDNYKSKNFIKNKEPSAIVNSADINTNKLKSANLELELGMQNSYNEDSLPLNEGVDNILATLPSDSVEAFFARLDKRVFPFKHDTDPAVNFIVDMVFEVPTNIKILPDIGRFTSKCFSFYVLDKNEKWQLFEKNVKCVAYGLKLVLQLVDHDGVTNYMQIQNIYKELYTFVINNHGHIRTSDFELSLKKIEVHLKQISHIKFELVFYLVTEKLMNNRDFRNFFIRNHLAMNGADSDDKVLVVVNGMEIATVKYEPNFKSSMFDLNSHSVFSINSKLYLSSNPLETVEHIFDVTEKFMKQFESRLLTPNMQILGEKEYMILIRNVANYINICEKNGIQLGGPILKRLVECELLQ